MVIVAATGVACSASAQSNNQNSENSSSREPGYSAFDAMAEAYQRGDARRRWEVGRQMTLIQDQRRWNGLPPTVPLERTGPNTVSFYAYGNRWDLPACAPVFEPWPYVPGFIWGYRFDDPAPQPIDRREVQTGPNRWVSYPVYPGDIEHGQQPPTRRAVEKERSVERDEVELPEQLPVPPPPEPTDTSTRSGPRRY
jgi:hypothetical protein